MIHEITQTIQFQFIFMLSQHFTFDISLQQRLFPKQTITLTKAPNPKEVFPFKVVAQHRQTVLSKSPPFVYHNLYKKNNKPVRI